MNVHLAVMAIFVCSFQAQAQRPEVLKGLGDHRDNSGGTVASGLKEALEVGTKNIVAQTGVTNEFLRHEAIKILLPEKLRPLEKEPRLAGQGQKVDDFDLSMNRAAEKAAPAASSIFRSGPAIQGHNRATFASSFCPGTEF